MYYIEYFDSDLKLKDIYFNDEKKLDSFFKKDFQDIIILSVYSFLTHEYDYFLEYSEFENILKVKEGIL